MAKLMKLGTELMHEHHAIDDEEVADELKLAQIPGEYLSTTTLWLVWRFAFPPHAELHVVAGYHGDSWGEDDPSSLVLVADLKANRVCQKRLRWTTQKTAQKTDDEGTAGYYLAHASYRNPHSMLDEADHYSTLSPIRLDSERLGVMPGATAILAAHTVSVLNGHCRRHALDEEAPAAETHAPDEETYMPEGDSLWRDCRKGIQDAIDKARTGESGVCNKVGLPSWV
jgi:hypothetical protein